MPLVLAQSAVSEQMKSGAARYVDVEERAEESTEARLLAEILDAVRAGTNQLLDQRATGPAPDATLAAAINAQTAAIKALSDKVTAPRARTYVVKVADPSGATRTYSISED